MENNANETYWQGRADYSYYKTVHELIRKHCPEIVSMLDVGTGPTLYLDYYDADRIVSVDIEEWDMLKTLKKNVEVIKSDFYDFDTPERFEVVLCMQTMEHVQDQKRFFEHLKKFATKFVIISVPYKWTQPEDHADIDENTVLEWTGMEPVESVVDMRRYIAVYKVS